MSLLSRAMMRAGVSSRSSMRLASSIASQPVSYEATDGKFDKQLKHALSTPVTESRNRAYFMIGGSRFALACVGRAVVIRFVATMSAAANVLALASVEVSVKDIPAGSTATIKWRGKPVFIRHRTQEEIAISIGDDTADLRDPQTDEERVTKPEWLVVLGVCTHLGCVPVSNAGNYNGWFCPCHGSHYDLAGRIRLGPAPLNLEIPEYSFIDDSTVKIG